MDKQITPEIESQLQALCHEISVGRRLDDEVQEELYGHLEDKYLAYINKEEEVGPQDAVILVREHFGDTATVEEMLRGVHEQAPGHSFWHGIFALIISYHSVAIIVSGLTTYLATTTFKRSDEFTLTSPHSLMYYYAIERGRFFYVVLIWILLMHWWKRKHDAGKVLWYTTCPVSYLSTISLLLIVLTSWIELHLEPYTSHNFGVVVSIFLLPVFYAYGWLWWMHRSYQHIYSSTRVMLVWAGYYYASFIISRGLSIITAGTTHLPVFILCMVLLQTIVYAGAAILLFSIYLSWREKKLILA